MRKFAITLAVVASASSAHADEGMWLPEQLPDVADRMRTLGLELDPASLVDLHAHPLGAVVSLGGCSASFVSEEGLVVTNHHCAVGALQHNSTPELNLLDTGFLAESRTDEIWAGPGSRVLVTESIVDVTDRVLGDLTAELSDLERYEAIDLAIKDLVAECESAEGVRCSVPSYFEGAEYRLIRQLEIEDVRIAYAPPSMVGFYGGDEDNWMWPRHVGDFTFFRAYVGPDGLPAAHSDDNVPYEPPQHLEIRTIDLDEGDFVMVAGYPGRTYRFRTGNEMSWARSTTYPWNIATMEQMIVLLDVVAEEDEDAAVRTQGMNFGLSNYLKNNRGMLDGFESSGAVERTVERDRAMAATLAAGDSAESQAWLAGYEELMTLLDASRVTEDRDRLVGWMNWSVGLLSTANTALWLAHERPLADEERDRGYQERDWPRLAERVARLDMSFHSLPDQLLLAYFMERLDALDDPAIEPVVELFLGFADDDAADDPYTSAAAEIYANTLLGDPDERSGLLEAEVVDITEARDPILQLAAALYPLLRENGDIEEERAGAFNRLRPLYLAALRHTSPIPLYPDANGTLRVTFGMVRGYDGADAVWYRPFTTVQGVVEKHTDEEPFDAPDELLAAIASGEWGPYVDPDLDSVAVDFLSTLDTTGGNSGSVTLDSQGRLCGLLFDGNYEAMASDWVFDPISTRSIHTGAQYMLWMMDRVAGAHRLMREMGVEPHFAESTLRD